MVGNFLLYLIGAMLLGIVVPLLVENPWGYFVLGAAAISILITMMQSILKRQKDIEGKLDRLLKEHSTEANPFAK